MAYTTTDIANSALLKVGARQITSIDDDLPEARTIKARYAQLFDSLLSKYPYACALKRLNLAPDAGYVKQFKYDYSFLLPSDCLHLWNVVDADGMAIFDYVQEGQNVLCHESSIGILYSRRITGLGIVDHDVAEMLACHLAAEISDRIDPDRDRTLRLKQEAISAERLVRTSDARRQSPRGYGGMDPFGKVYLDTPKTWLDSRL